MSTPSLVHHGAALTAPAVDVIVPPPPAHDFLSWYLHWCREGTAPTNFHRWVGLSVLSAALQDRVQYARDAWQVGRLSLYVMLLGDSGIGKGTAMLRGLDAIGPFNTNINPFYGKITSAGLLSRLGGKITGRKRGDFIPRHWAKMWLMVEELAHGMRTGPEAKETLTTLTDLWGKSDSMEITRTKGQVVIKGLSLSVLLGTTATWLPNVFDESTIGSGTLARFLIVEAPPTFTGIKSHHVQYPDGYRDLDRYIKDYVTAYSYMGAGTDTPTILQWDPEALAEKDALVANLQAAYPERYFAAHLNRAEEMISKLAALVAVAGWPLTYYQTAQGYHPTIEVPARPIISVYAVRRGAGFYRDALRCVPKVMQIIAGTQWTRETEQVLGLIQDAGEGRSLPTAVVMRQARRRHGITGINAKKALAALLETGEINRGLAPETGTPCVWATPIDDDDPRLRS